MKRRNSLCVGTTVWDEIQQHYDPHLLSYVVNHIIMRRIFIHKMIDFLTLKLVYFRNRFLSWSDEYMWDIVDEKLIFSDGGGFRCHFGMVGLERNLMLGGIFFFSNCHLLRKFEGNGMSKKLFGSRNF